MQSVGALAYTLKHFVSCLVSQSAHTACNQSFLFRDLSHTTNLTSPHTTSGSSFSTPNNTLKPFVSCLVPQSAHAACNQSVLFIDLFPHRKFHLTPHIFLLNSHSVYTLETLSHVWCHSLSTLQSILPV